MWVIGLMLTREVRVARVAHGEHDVVGPMSTGRSGFVLFVFEAFD